MSEEQSVATEANVESPLSQATATTPEPSIEASGPQIPEKFGGDVGKLVESYNHLESKMGSMYALPSEDSSQERWSEFDQRIQSTGRYLRIPNSEDQKSLDSFYNTLGRPETPDGYQFSIKDEVKPYVDNTIVNQYSELAHQVGLTKSQAQALVDFEINRGIGDLQQMEQNKSHAEQQLRQSWGQDYDNRLAGAKAAVQSYSDKFPDAVNRLMNGPEGNNPVLISMLSELGQAHRESGHVGTSNAPQYGMSSDDARDKIREIMDNQSHPYYNASHPGHSEAVTKVKKLYGIAYPEG